MMNIFNLAVIGITIAGWEGVKWCWRKLEKLEKNKT